MTGDPADILARLKSVLPPGWFADTTPILDTVLSGLSDAGSRLYGLLAVIRLETRIATASDTFLDGAANDFFGLRLRRRVNESDDPFRTRLTRALTRTRATRAALVDALVELTGHVPIIFEPSRPGDTGAWSVGGIGWNVAGGWGSLSLPFQSFVTIARPRGQGIATLAGYGTGGPLSYASLAMIRGQVTDADIYAEIAATLPVASIAWTSITG